MLQNKWGSVRPYTRHVATCKFRRRKDYNDCECPKWLYEYPRDRNLRRKNPRRSLNTPRWNEALKEANHVLDGFNPEIARARAHEEQQNKEMLTVEAACKLWLDKTLSSHGSEGAYRQYATIANKLVAWARKSKIEFIQDITPVSLAQWYTSPDWTGYTPGVRQQWWVSLRGMFKYLVDLQVLSANPILATRAARRKGSQVQGPYTDEQIKAILAHVADGVSGRHEEAAARLRAAIHLLLFSGCDLIDAVLFHQDKISTEKIGGKTYSVFRYHRRKTGIVAVVPLPQEVVAIVRSAPPGPNSPPGMPFRSSAEVKVRSDTIELSRQIRLVLKGAEVRWVELPPDEDGRVRRKAANAKQFRHTAAIRWLCEGHSIETVARMMGHSDTSMLRRHYAPWVKELDLMHVRSVVERWSNGDVNSDADGHGRGSSAEPALSGTRRSAVVPRGAKVGQTKARRARP